MMILGIPKHKIDRALIICSGPSAGPVVVAGLPKLEGVTLVAVNQAINTIPSCDYWVCCCKYAAEEYQGNAKNVLVVRESLQYNEYTSGKVSMDELPEGYLIERDSDAVGFVLDGKRLCRHNAGLAAVNAMVVMGCKRIAILGFDGTMFKWFHPHKHEKRHEGTEEKSWREVFIDDWKISAEQMKTLGVEIQNGSPNSECQEWPRCTPEEALSWI